MRPLLAFLIAFALLPAAAARANDTTPPHTTITQLPGVPYDSRDSYTHSYVYWPADAVTYFQADEPATFECRSWDSAWYPCTSPVTRPTIDIGLGGEHLFIRATDAAGNVEQTPAHTFWSVEPPEATVYPSASGTFKVGQTLTCDTGVWAEPLMAPSLVEWGRDLSDRTLTVGTGLTYTVTPADVGHTMVCDITFYTSPRGWWFGAETRRIPARAAQLPASECPATEPASAHDANTYAALDSACGLSVSSDESEFYLDTDGDASTGDAAHRGADRYVRFADGAAILAYWSAGDFAEAAVLKSEPLYGGRTAWTATGAQLGLKPDRTMTLYGDGGSAVSLDVVAARGEQPGDPPTTTTPPAGDERSFSGAVAFHAPTAVNVKRPSLSGRAKPGYVLRCSSGTWKGAAELAYAWTRDGKRIKGESKRSYTVRVRDRGHRIGCTVSAGGKSVAARAVKVKR